MRQCWGRGFRLAGRRSPMLNPIESRQVNWWAVHEFVASVEAVVPAGERPPWPGTPAWCEMDDRDTRKLLAVAKFGVHHALRVETAQQARAEASKAIAAATDWRSVAGEITQRRAAERAGARVPRQRQQEAR
jgi:hypothetical protein